MKTINDFSAHSAKGLRAVVGNAVVGNASKRCTVTLRGVTHYVRAAIALLTMVLTATTAGAQEPVVTFTPAPGQAEALTSIEAGKPYIIKWAEPTGYVAYNGENAATCSDIVNPVFRGVTLDATDRSLSFDLDTTEGQEKGITFSGTYDAMAFDADEPSILFLGGSNTLYYPQSGAKIGAQRAYFQLDGLTAGESTSQVRAFNLNFGDEDTGITTTDFLRPDGSKRPEAERTDLTDSAGAWYTLDGRKLDGKPTRKGLYIHGGRKVVIK